MKYPGMVQARQDIATIILMTYYNEQVDALAEVVARAYREGARVGRSECEAELERGGFLLR